MHARILNEHFVLLDVHDRKEILVQRIDFLLLFLPVILKEVT